MTTAHDDPAAPVTTPPPQPGTAAAPPAEPARDHAPVASTQPAAHPTGQPPPGQLGLPDLLGTAAQVVGAVAAPVTLITGLLYYFGWSHDTSYFRYFGIDHTLLGFSIQDYVLRSIRPMIWPLLIGVTIALVWVNAHLVILRRVAGQHDAVVRASWGASLLGTVGFVVALRDAATVASATTLYGRLRGPLGLAASATLVAYSVYLRRRLTADANPQPPGSQPAGPARTTAGSRWLGWVSVTLVVLLIAVTMFWAVALYAAYFGEYTGYRLATQRLADKPTVFVYSAQRLHLNPAGGVQEEPIGDAASAFRFRYANLKLLTRANSKYFLLPADWSAANPIAIVLPDDPSIRVEFIPPGVPMPTG